jgi:hypothetical protein
MFQISDHSTVNDKAKSQDVAEFDSAHSARLIGHMHNGWVAQHAVLAASNCVSKPNDRKKDTMTGKPNAPVQQDPALPSLLNSLRGLIRNARQQVLRNVDLVQVRTCWEIGRHIVEFEQGGSERAEYGKRLLEFLARDLTTEFGKGFDASNLRYMRLFYQSFPIRDALRHELSWTHYRLVAGMAGSVALTQLMARLLYSVSAFDPMIFSAAALGLAFIAMAACYIPARRSMGVDPLIALRQE